MKLRDTLLAFALLPALSQAAPPCTPQTAIDVSKIAQQIIVVGEMHGTEQAPRLVSGLVCSLLQSGHGVILALERNGAEQPALVRYIESSGSAADRAALWQQPDWRNATQDGRSSAALMALIDDVRKLRGSGQRIGILAMQQVTTELAPLRVDEKTMLAEREALLYSRINDRSMADNLLAAGVLYGNYKIVALAGGVHTGTKRPDWAEPGYLPMGALVLAERPAYFIGLRSEGGTAWVCGRGGVCGPREVGAGAFVAADTKIDAEASLGPITASPPAAKNP
ncbi:hypothetical protein J2X20_004469 [Pelomonas saccharophila]|uniref:Haem-binding uptake Tiki superfamily ChaN domain-containing protein n=1 Tax=Roseateles saccharophilus TaxID=304 RepID=A0ABU1YSH4_ROSSA|nr:hypothetical protein [Roseateles saccharophilus]MDR7271801.1 hypothetical protein [Roseateles saccharophilus]